MASPYNSARERRATLDDDQQQQQDTTPRLTPVVEQRTRAHLANGALEFSRLIVTLLLDELDATRAERDRLRTALAFYANPAHWHGRLSSEPGNMKVWADQGQLARQVLADVPAGDEGGVS